MTMKKKVIKHLKGDIKTFKKEAKEDKELIKALKHKKEESKKHENKEKHHDKKDPKPYPKGKKAKSKEEKVMHEFKTGKLHSGSKRGPVVTNRKQAVAIALSEARRAKKKK